jgi:hypothetical protein
MVNRLICFLFGHDSVGTLLRWDPRDGYIPIEVRVCRRCGRAYVEEDLT